jgi:hypothetical protein
VPWWRRGGRLPGRERHGAGDAECEHDAEVGDQCALRFELVTGPGRTL